MSPSTMQLALLTTIVLGSWTPVHADVVTEWNARTLACVQGPATPPMRPGPAGLLDIALVQAAVHDAVQAIEGRFEPYQYRNPALRDVGSSEAAAASAAYGVLAGLYQSDAKCLENVPDPAVTYAGDPGLQAGAEAAAALLPLYRSTIVLPTDPFVGGTEPGQWRVTPGVTHGTGTFLAHTAPFAMNRPSQFRPAPPPPLSSRRYLREYNEVKAIGSQWNSARTPEQDDVARFWTANFFSQWNATLREIAEQYLDDTGDRARLLALASIAAADSQISAYEAKYHYNFWRPVTAIREGDHDGAPKTIGDPTWTPLIPTPAFPDHTSGANCLTAAITTVLRHYFGTDALEFTVSSSAPDLLVNPRTYQRLSEIEKEMIGVRVLQGIHFRSAEVAGRKQGQRIGHWTFKKYLRPIRSRN